MRRRVVVIHGAEFRVEQTDPPPQTEETVAGLDSLRAVWQQSSSTPSVHQLRSTPRSAAVVGP